MYAHQVIEDMKSAIKKINNPDNKYENIMEIALEQIPLCQQFHFDADSTKAVWNSTKSGEAGQEFFECRETAIKMPYKYMWFDYNDALLKKRLAVMVLHYSPEELPVAALDQYELFAFEKLNPSSPWTMARKIVFVKKGEIEEYTSTPTANEYDDSMIGYCGTLVHKSIMLLNCKNIVTEIIKAPGALNKKRRKNGKQEIFDYHVLNVTVPGKKQGYREQSEPLSHVRVHLCRGHFKEYTKDHPLFGKLTGLYWWQPHVRGQNKDGIVMKDYEIKTEEA